MKPPAETKEPRTPAQFGPTLGDDKSGDADCWPDTEADPIIEADR